MFFAHLTQIEYTLFDMNPKELLKGFSLVSLLISFAIIAIIAVLILKKSNNEQDKSLPEVQERAEQDLDKINTNLENYQEQIDIQNELNIQ